MDPLACIKRIADAIQENNQEEIDAALRDLWKWVSGGGYLPLVTGPVLGTRPRALPAGVVGLAWEHIYRVQTSDNTLVLEWSGTEWTLKQYSNQTEGVAKHWDDYMTAFASFPRDPRDLRRR